MTAVAKLSAGAPSAKNNNWNTIEWPTVIAQVRRLQLRIAKAFREEKHGRVKALQWILTHSFYAKLLAVRKVVQNKGAKTPGIDNVTWKTPKQKMQAALSLKNRGYKTNALKRIYIPKKQKGKLRPLSIPVMKCRGMQALHLLSLEPIAETIADRNSYGFRPLRSAADAIQQCFIALARKGSATYIFEADIHSCLDKISHSWIVENTMMNKKILKKWLNAGYMEKSQIYPTIMGTPQGGLISAAILVIVLSGLERTIKSAVKSKDKVHLSIYADDFIVTGTTREVLEQKVKPVVDTFLKERGLTLSVDKTQITHIHEGFDFLGMNVRKYKSKLIIKPAKSSTNRLKADISEIIKNNATSKAETLIQKLNPMVRGWANYYRHVCSKETFGIIDDHIFKSLWKWAKRRHRSKPRDWIKKKYFRRQQNRDWIFSAKSKDKQGECHNLDIFSMSKTPIKRHIKVRADATPFDPAYHKYYDWRYSGCKNEKGVKGTGRWSKWWGRPSKPKLNINVGPSTALQKV